jgi:hypothetical protein
MDSSKKTTRHRWLSFFIVRLKFQKQSELNFVSRTIPQSGGCNTPQLALGFHTRDFVRTAKFGDDSYKIFFTNEGSPPFWQIKVEYSTYHG